MVTSLASTSGGGVGATLAHIEAHHGKGPRTRLLLKCIMVGKPRDWLLAANYAMASLWVINVRSRSFSSRGL